MSYFVFAYLAFQCPGGLLAGFVPAKIQPFVCAPRIEIERFSSREQAHRRYREIGHGRLQWCRGLKCFDRKVTSRTILEIE